MYVENVSRDFHYLCTGEYLQPDLDIVQFDFMFVKPHDVPPPLALR